MTARTMLDYALLYGAKRIPVFPVNRDKTPLTRSGFKDATTDEAKLIEWFGRRWPNAGIAMPTGHVSGIVVIDVDPRHGGAEGIAQCTQRLGSLPPTLTASTPSGGWHFYLRPPEGVVVRNSAGRLAPGVDVRGEGGYVVLPPSRNGAGEWTFSTRGAIAVLPEKWVQAMVEAPAPMSTAVKGATPSQEWVAMLRGPIEEGRRNDSLTRLAGYLLRKYVDPDVVEALLLIANRARCHPPLSDDEVVRIVESVGRCECRRRGR